ncbi:MAG: RsmF rRNA methyltransferase first C-terminal domain-containing protein, partial [Clostridia bacterium]|nr:RsmF rRNA methyltransferase first C-terminal domain-containing protein [Clostridia bacterium]
RRRFRMKTRGVDFPRRGADSDKSKEIEMIDERYPAAFLDECREILKDEFPAFLRALALPPRRALRLNPQRNGAEQAAAPFLPDGAPRVPWEVLGRYLAADAKPGAGIAHAAGAFYLQDASAMAPVAVLDPQPGERVLDLCAAPGGKSGQIAARLNGRGFLLSNEIEFSRARILLGNLERLGVTNAFVTSAPAEALARALPAFFDRVLVDAPCSGEGMFRRDPEAASQWNPGAPAGCAARQTAILNDAARMVRPGGRLVYSTCTFNRLENEGTVREFLRTHPDFEPDAFELPGVGASRDGCLRLWPHRIEGEGHFLARFTRKGEETCARNVSLPEARASEESGRIEFETFPVRALPEARASAESGRVESETFSVRASKGSGRFESPNAKPRTDNSRRASAPKSRAAASRAPRGKEASKPDLSEFVHALPEGEIVVDGDEVRLVSALAPDPAKLTGVRVLRAGLPLATLGRSHIEPAHALAMALDPETARQTIDLTDEQAASYLSGEAFPVDAPSGWTLAAWRGLPLGWCKITGGTLKNHLPKGLRRRG